MPIYSYRCDSCGNQQDILRKMSDPPLTVCPACGASTFRKQVTAAGFQLKGSGWYVTDFRNPATKDGAKAGKSDGEGSPAAASPPPDAKSTDAPAPAKAADSPAPTPSAPKSDTPSSGTTG